MRKGLAFLIVFVLGVFAVKSVVSSPDKVQLSDTAKYPVPTYGLHVAQPVDMKGFPSDVIPLP
ncbi:MAG TPA: hypothetical protein VFB29_11900 [Pseudolabrys sp.]|nr:hypothetical protein [Pseudolabrys sp.]